MQQHSACCNEKLALLPMESFVSKHIVTNNKRILILVNTIFKKSPHSLPVTEHFTVLTHHLVHCVLLARLSSVMLRLITCPRLHSYSHIQIANLFTPCQLCWAPLGNMARHCACSEKHSGCKLKRGKTLRTQRLCTEGQEGEMRIVCAFTCSTWVNQPIDQSINQTYFLKN